MEKLFSGIIMDSRHGEDWLSCDLVEVSELENHLVAIHVCSDSVSENDPRLCKGYPVVKKINLRGSTAYGSFARKVIKRLAKHCAAISVMLEIDPSSPPRTWVSLARYYANQLPETSVVLAIHKGKTIFKRQSVHQLLDFTLDLRSEWNLSEETGSHMINVCEDDLNDKESSKEGNIDLNCIHKEKTPWDSSITFGWPLLLKVAPTASEVSRTSKDRSLSVVQWVMSLPSRSSPVILDNQNDSEQIEGSTLYGIQNFGDKLVVSKEEERDNCSYVDYDKLEFEWLTMSNPPVYGPNQSQIGLSSNNIVEPVKSKTCRHLPETIKENNLKTSRQQSKKLGSVIRTDSSVYKYKLFSYAELKNATSEFSTENFIGEGGCSTVYKGYLPDGKNIVVKVLKPYKEAWNDLSLEIKIVSSIKHKNIAPLIGVCVENDWLMSVYDYFPGRSLEENIHGEGGRYILPWEIRFKVAISIAEALNYLHSECSPPVIHRDVKSANILLSEEFQPQLSDFGLAIWGPKGSTYMIDGDVVGTFGYIAPEYIVQGKVSNKTDVYAFGIVLLELLSGRRPISTQASKGKESLVKWANVLFKNGNLKALMDPKLSGEFNVVEAQRMILAASLCINQSARLRPNASQIVKLLRGDYKDVNEFMNSDIITTKELSDQDDNDIFSELNCKPYLDFSMLDSMNDIVISPSADKESLISAKRSNRRLKLRDYLKQEQD